jgi:Zn-finger nucleic acid-binding protein
MICPVCSEKMKEVQRQGVDIDICPGCKGVWLDRGELEKIIAIDAGNAVEPSTRTDPKDRIDDRPKDRDYEKQRSSRDDDDDDDRKSSRDREGYDDRKDRYDPRDPRKKKKGSFLGDILGAFGGGED